MPEPGTKKTVRYDINVHGHGGGFVWEITRNEDGQNTHAKDGREVTARKARREAEGWVRILQTRDARPEQPYIVAPFSGKDYFKNEAQGNADEPPCAICGKGIKNVDTAHSVVVIDGGAAWGDKDSDVNDDGYMGGYLVGPSCHRKHRRKL